MSPTVVTHGAARRALMAALLVAPMIFGCATPPTNPAERAAFEQANDPLEPLNRNILDVNMAIDKFFFRPIAVTYVTVFPEPGRDALHRVLQNLKEPVVAINSVLQGRIGDAGTTAGRFAINSTVGLAGMLEVAKGWGLEPQQADFGQTLYAWGLPDGPYLVLPVFGPSNPRDGIGMGVDAYLDPFNYVATKADLDTLQIARYVADGVDRRAAVLDVLDDLQKNSLDFYAQLRSLSQQQRNSELHRGESAAPAANFYSDPAKSAPPPPAASPAPGSAAKPAASRRLPPKPIASLALDAGAWVRLDR